MYNFTFYYLFFIFYYYYFLLLFTAFRKAQTDIKAVTVLFKTRPNKLVHDGDLALHSAVNKCDSPKSMLVF